LERDRAIIEHAADAFFVYDAGGSIFDVNRRACETLGYTREELLSLFMTDVEAILLPEGIAGLWRRLASGEPVTTEGAQRRKDGTAFPVEIRVGLLGEVDGRRLALSIAHDITGRKAFEEKLSHQAFHDSLSGLPNRILLMDRLEQALARAHRRKTPLTMVFLDLDGFKVVNDSLGHDTGDRLLKEVGRRLDSGARPSDTVARLGGDEFVVLLEDIGDEREVCLVAERMKREFEAPFKLGQRELSVTASIGVAVGPTPGGGPRELLRNADWRCIGQRRAARTATRCTIPARPHAGAVGAGGACERDRLT
jgi:diguanylate cyclase (GGDEF)-like protein/PAS domain S-box-containing protein